MSTSLRKMELEKNNFIRKLSQEQFDGVITSKYKKVFHEYFDGTISDSELAKKVESNMELISIYTNGDDGKIDPNQYLYSAIVDVALDYFNVANSYETCMNKLNLLASYFQLIASCESQLKHLEDAIYDAFFIHNNFNDCDDYLKRKLKCVSNLANSLDVMLDEVLKHEDVIDEVESKSNAKFLDESLIDDSIKEMHLMFQNTLKSTMEKFVDLQKDCVDSTGAKLDIMHGKFIKK